MRAARTPEPRVLERAEMPTGPSTKVEIPVPVARKDRLDKGNKSRGNISGAKPPATTTSGAGGWLVAAWVGPYFQPDCSWEQAPRDPGSQPTLQESPGQIQSGEAPPGPAPVGNGGDSLRAALERKSSWTDQKKATQSDESPHPRTSTPSTGPLLHSCSPRPHPTNTKPANSILCGSCVHIPVTFPFPPISIPRRVSSFQVTKGSSPVKGVLWSSLCKLWAASKAFSSHQHLPPPLPATPSRDP